MGQKALSPENPFLDTSASPLLKSRKSFSLISKTIVSRTLIAGIQEATLASPFSAFSSNSLHTAFSEAI